MLIKRCCWRLTGLHGHSFRPQSPPAISGWEERVPGCHSRGQRDAMQACRVEAQSASIFTKPNPLAIFGSTATQRASTQDSTQGDQIQSFSSRVIERWWPPPGDNPASGRRLSPPGPNLGNVTCNICRRSSLRPTPQHGEGVASASTFSSRRVTVGCWQVTGRRRRHFKSLIVFL